MYLRFVLAATAGLIMGLAIAFFIGSHQIQAKQAKEQRWEYKVVSFPVDSNKATEQLNALASDGWEYVGLINTSVISPFGNPRDTHESSVAFRRLEEPADPSKTKLFKEKSVWKNENSTLTVLKVDGETFEARFEIAGDNIEREIKGTIKDGKVSWLAKDVHAVKGNEGGDNSGTITTDKIGDKIDFVRREKNGESGRYTLRLSKEK